MSDPYNTLGVSSDASDDEVKKAYRELARKYHPDNYHDNPLSDLAQEKMKQINEAYDEITRMREGKGKKGGYQPGTGYADSPNASAEGARVRAAINSGDIRLAEDLLRSFPTRNAEWNFLMGSVYYRKGWLDDARRHFMQAVNMEPNNPEYRQALAFMNQGGMHRTYGRGGLSNQGCDACDICAAMMCCSMCCR